MPIDKRHPDESAGQVEKLQPSQPLKKPEMVDDADLRG